VETRKLPEAQTVRVAVERLDNLINLFNSYIKIYRYPGKFFYHYPMKVNQNKEFVLPLVTEGANLETGSANELKLVKKMLLIVVIFFIMS